MKVFNLPSCSTEDVMRVKKDIKTKSNNKSAQTEYQSLFGDTQIAVSNIQECLNNPNDMEQRLSLIHNGDVSFADDMIGLTPRGNGASRYRAFLALNERDILEIRIGNHYETEKVALAKSNNKAQFLCQVVLITTPPQPESDDAITSTTSVGNLHVLTKKLISSNSSIDDLRNVLISIKDYLISPTKSYEDSINDNNNNNIKTENYMRNNKRTIRLTESDLHRLVKESVRRILDEHETGLDWRTLQNAAFKSYNRGYDEHFDDKEEFERDMERTGRFAQAARDAFEQQHPTSRGRLVHGNGRRSGHTDAMGYPSPLARFYPGYDSRSHTFTGNVEHFLDSTGSSGHSYCPPRSRMTPAEKEVVDFATGETKYVPGKGWQ